LAFIPFEVVLIQDAYSSLNTVQDIKGRRGRRINDTGNISLGVFSAFYPSFSLQQKFSGI